ncbi:antitermination protein [Pantoea agglomerans]|uniref:antitermination protein n=1 Tax=Enterobacter agglomerans TaxID=549 RepID=UPI00177CD88C|nr:antitermination protein [Pantoea agglomerans]MBD8260505.1 antitermination protein [Pantoea agglomerans]
MGLEATVKYHFAKTASFAGMPPATASDALSGTDYMAAMGMTQSRAPLGYSAFMGKVGVSDNDARRAVSLLTKYALSTCDKVAALRKLDTDIKPAVMQTLATYAYMDYCRSAASVKPCECCQAKGFIEADVFTMKSPLSGGSSRSVKEVVRVICKACNGKGVVSSSCRDCSGRGRAVDRKLTGEQGVPVMGDCKRCCGRGYERIPSTDVHRTISGVTDAVSLDTWKKSVKPFYDGLIGKIEMEESWANAALNQVTR